MMMLATTRSLVRKSLGVVSSPTSTHRLSTTITGNPISSAAALFHRHQYPHSALVVRGFSTVPTDDGDGEATKVEEEKTATPTPPPPQPSGSSSTTTAASTDELKKNLKPSEIVESLNRHIVGQHDAKRAVAIAMRNRWRRRQLSDDLRKEVTPRNVLLVGPTGYVFAFLCISCV